MNDRILIIAAHPDDEVLGCAGTICRHIEKKDTVKTLILFKGLDSRKVEGESLESSAHENLRSDALEANLRLGVTDVEFLNFPDNRGDQVALLDIIKAIEQVKESFKPTIVYTHYRDDLNIDHQITYRATMTAFRPIHGEKTTEILSYFVLSSTEWQSPQSFTPDTFVCIEPYLEHKLAAMRCYKDEIRDYPHPRSIEGIKTAAKYWGMISGLKYAEPMVTARRILPS